MTRIPFDQLSKQLLEEFLSPLGRVERSFEVPGESRLVDVWFQPTAPPAVASLDLGLLSRMVAHPCLLEPFRNPPSPTEVRRCLGKLFAVEAHLQRQAKRVESRLREVDLPRLWLLVPSASPGFINGFHLQPDPQWGQGLYFWGEFELAALVAIHQLPPTPDTLWLRLLGRGRVQRQAIEDAIALSEKDPRRDIALRVLANWKFMIEVSPEADADRELLMALSQAYLEWEQATERRGIQQGIAREISLVVRLLNRRLGELDPALVKQVHQLPIEQVEDLGEALLAFECEEDLRRWLDQIQPSQELDN